MNQDEVKKLLNEILNFIGVSPRVIFEEDDEDNLCVNIEGGDLSFLIGYRGESLDALQTLMSQAFFRKNNEWPRLLIDVNCYRKQKHDKIEQITKNYIDKVRFFGKEVEMNPMSPSERRQVHSFVSTYDDVMSESVGEGLNRRVVIKPKA
jgi:spoIIIJ-associated protein